MKELLFLVPVVGLAGLLFAIFLKSYVIKQDPGNDKMREIADAIAEGARAFLASEYRILVIFVAVLFVVIGVGTRNWVTAVCFLTGSIFSTAAGYLGMSAAIRAYRQCSPHPWYETCSGTGIFRRKCYGYGSCWSWAFRCRSPLSYHR